MRNALFLALLGCCIPQALNAQGQLEIPRYEIGVQADLRYLDGVGDGGGGLGGRFHYNFDEHLALDSEFIYRQHNVSVPVGTTVGTGVIGQTTGLVGLRAGQRFENVGFFVRARAGILHFGNDGGVTLLSRKTFPAFDVGGTLERYLGPMIWRFELGELIVPYGNATASPGPYQVQPPLAPLRTRANPVFGIGFAVRF